MSVKHQEPSNATNGQSPGCDPKTTSKRSSGIFSFFKWFKPSSTSRESVTRESSPSSSCDSLNSTASAGTIASFSFVLPAEYKPEVVAKNIVPGPETDTYRARLKQRDNRRERDKNVTLRKKYNLFFSRDAAAATLKPLQIEEDNSKSLPLMTRKDMESESEKLYRRTNSESSKFRKAGAYCHVKGKRKAPQPPVAKSKSTDAIGATSTMSLRRRKRLAPQPPSALTPNKVKTSLLNVDIEYADADDVLCNDSLKLDHGLLKPIKEADANHDKSPRASYAEAPVSPRPWYKRNREPTPAKKDKEEERYEPISLYCKSTLVNPESSKQNRKSGMSFLTNISELDREASDIVKKEHEDAPAFMRLKVDAKGDTDTWTSPKRRSAKDLIAKFNAITNVTKVTVNSAFFGVKESNAFQKRDYFGKAATCAINDATKQNKTEAMPLQQHRRQEVDSSPSSNNTNKIPLVKSESSAVVTKSYKDAPLFDKKCWFCPKCSLENDYWRIICYVCSTIKPYFDDLTAPPAKNNTLEKNKTQISEINHHNPLRTSSDTSKNIAHQQAKPAGNMHALERSRTQIGFSALAKHNVNQFVKSSSVEERKPNRASNDKQEERERLKKMLIEMKNSLPKRRLNPSEKHTNRTSVIQESTENATKLENEPPDKVVEVTLATQETIYENIKMKKTANPKPVKVSSSVQTNAKPPVNLGEMFKNQDGNYEPMRPKDFAHIYTVKIEGLQDERHAYKNVEQTGDLFLNVPAKLNDFKNNLPANTDTLEVNRLLKRLEVAIAKGELNEASDLARELAQLKVNCSVIRQKSVENADAKKGFVVNMYVEDKISHRGPFPINVRHDQTIVQLKMQVEEEFQLPLAVQRWIIGKELVTDDDATLKDLKVTTDGCPLFLYLVAPAKETKLTSGSHNIVKDELVEVKDEAAATSRADKELNNVNIPSAATKLDVDTKASTPVASTSLNSHSDPKDDQSPKEEAKIIQTPLVTNTISTAGATNRAVTTNITPSFHSVTTKDEAPLLVKLANDDEFEEFDTKTLKPQKNQWECLMCTFLNPPSSNVCTICATVRKINGKAAPQNQERHYQQLINLDNADLVENVETFECLICLSDIPPRAGATLRECLHQFCKHCLVHTVEYTEEAEVKCPYRDNEYSCDLPLQDREIKALLTPIRYEIFLARSVAQAENKMDKSFHCKTPDCKGWCVFEDNVNEFHCPVCRRTNCLTCQVIHMGLNCKQYQESINESTTDENAKRTKLMLEEMVSKGEAIKCPTCAVILMKKWGCDWLRCSMCKTEICWVTRGPRWGPAGKGDTSGGCRCGVNAIKCHPKCNYCH